MQKEQIHRKPKYFFAVFGLEKGPPVDDGCYPHKKGHISNKGIAMGELVV